MPLYKMLTKKVGPNVTNPFIIGASIHPQRRSEHLPTSKGPHPIIRSNLPRDYTQVNLSAPTETALLLV